MRFAMLSDIHANSIALDAVLDDIRSQGGVDSYWILGDHVNQGYDPVGVMDRLSKLPEIRCVAGNTDRYVVKGGRLGPSMERILADPEQRIKQLESVEQGNGWARGALATMGWFEWLRDLPFEQRTTLPDGTRLLGVHASLVSDELGFLHDTSAGELKGRFPDCQADLIFAGHTHKETDLTFNDVRYVTLGCIANPMDSDLRAKYSILEASETGYSVIRRRVEFDYPSVVDAIKAAHHPSEPWLLKFYQRS